MVIKEKNMKLLIPISFVVFIITTAFQCGKSSDYLCKNQTKYEGATMHINVSGNSTSVRLNDTIWFETALPDSIFSITGAPIFKK